MPLHCLRLLCARLSLLCLCLLLLSDCPSILHLLCWLWFFSLLPLPCLIIVLRAFSFSWGSFACSVLCLPLLLSVLVCNTGGLLLFLFLGAALLCFLLLCCPCVPVCLGVFVWRVLGGQGPREQTCRASSVDGPTKPANQRCRGPRGTMNLKIERFAAPA